MKGFLVFVLCAAFVILIAVLSGGSNLPSKTERAESVASMPSPEPPPTQEELYRRGCKVIRERLENKPMSELTIKDTELLQTCTLLGH